MTKQTPENPVKKSAKASRTSSSKKTTLPPKMPPPEMQQTGMPPPESMTPENAGNQSYESEIKRMIRVDHAGEYGAVRIYEGQLAVLGESEHAPALRHMLEQEHGHLAQFNALLAERRVRPSALSPVWHAAAYALGAVTAAMGSRTAMACTVAVEDVIDEHYAEQEKTLDLIGQSPADKKLRRTISRFRAEEAEHRDEALRREAEKAPLYPVVSSGIKAVSRLAIWLSKRI